jgi:hypothetical protein
LQGFLNEAEEADVVVDDEDGWGCGISGHKNPSRNNSIQPRMDPARQSHNQNKNGRERTPSSGATTEGTETTDEH